jgi:GNAT superfamily N-acetyltransferase
MPGGSYELAKMGVAEEERGKGVGRILLEFVVGEARRLGIQRLYIETNHALKNAIHLYEAMGFRHIEPDAPSPYQRADVFMELLLSQTS